MRGLLAARFVGGPGAAGTDTARPTMREPAGPGYPPAGAKEAAGRGLRVRAGDAHWTAAGVVGAPF